MPIALDATYSLGPNLSGVGVYSREILYGLTQAHPEQEFLFCYRPHRFLPSYRESIPPNAVRRLLIGTPPADLFHALNQRIDTRARRTVTTFHDLFVITSQYSSPDFRATFTTRARQAAENCDLIIAVSQFTAQQIETLLGVASSKIRVIHHGVHLPAPSNTPRENIVLSVGAIQKRKNIARLVKAFERTPQTWKLLLAGAPDGYGAAAELEAVEQSPRRADIEVLGYVSPAILATLYQRAGIFAFPSLDEGFGIPVLEAMANRVPVITSTTSALPEVAGDAAILVDPLSTEAIGDALVELASGEQLRQNLIQRGLERAARFTWSSTVNKTWQIYNEIR